MENVAKCRINMVGFLPSLNCIYILNFYLLHKDLVKNARTNSI